MCYPITKYEFIPFIELKNRQLQLRRHIAAFLDREDIRKTLGVDPAVKVNFSSCNMEVGNRFHDTLDEMFPVEYYVAALLERGIRVLIYVGENDWGCNWVRCTSRFSLHAIGHMSCLGRQRTNDLEPRLDRQGCLRI